jgi:hypothetical protein
MPVIIGVDPHKASHTAVAIDGGEDELDRKKVRAGDAQPDQLVAWAEPFATRTWAIESAGGLGYLLAQQLVAVGEIVLDVRPRPGGRRWGRSCSSGLSLEAVPGTRGWRGLAPTGW